MQEIWKAIPRYEGLYEVSNLGKIRSVNRIGLGKPGFLAIRKGKILKPAKSKVGYLRCVIINEFGKINIPVHRAVAITFIPNPQLKETVNHKDGNKINNCIDNLEWMTVTENNRHARVNGLNVSKRGKEHHSYGLGNKQSHVLVHSISGELKPICEVAKEYGYTTRHITMMMKGERTNKTQYSLQTAP